MNRADGQGSLFPRTSNQYISLLEQNTTSDEERRINTISSSLSSPPINIETSFSQSPEIKRLSPQFRDLDARTHRFAQERLIRRIEREDFSDSFDRLYLFTDNEQDEEVPKKTQTIRIQRTYARDNFALQKSFKKKETKKETPETSSDDSSDSEISSLN